jgi:hypothetical protein
MARPGTVMDGSIYQSVVSAGSLAYTSFVYARLFTISMSNDRTINIRYNTDYSTGSLTATDGGYESYIQYTLQGSSPAQIITSGRLNEGLRGTYTVTGIATFPIVSIDIEVYSHQPFVLSDGDIATSITKTFIVKDHPGSTIVFTATPNTLLRLPPISTTDGNYYIIKNISDASTVLLQNTADTGAPIEYFPAWPSATDYSLEDSPTLSLDKRYAIGIFSYQNKWYIASFCLMGVYNDGASISPDIQLPDSTSVFFTDIGNSNKSVVLPNPANVSSCIIVSDRTTTTGSNGILRIKAPPGQVLDGVPGRTSHDLIVSSKRAGACAIHFISNPTSPAAWYVASISDFQYSDNYNNTGGEIAPSSNAFTAELGIQTTDRFVPDINVGRDFTIASLAPTPGMDISAGALRIVKQFTPNTNSYLGFVTANATFPASYSREANQYLFQYTGHGLNACVFIEIKRGDGTTRFYPLSIYPFIS